MAAGGWNSRLTGVIFPSFEAFVLPVQGIEVIVIFV
jgi:hypothetical protein